MNCLPLNRPWDGSQAGCKEKNAHHDLDCIEREQYSAHARDLNTGYVLSGSLLSLLLTGVLKDISEALSDLDDNDPVC